MFHFFSDNNTFRYLVYIVGIIALVFMLLSSYFYLQNEKVKHKKNDAENNSKLVRWMKKTRLQALSYSQLSTFLVRSGLTTMFPSLTPSSYIGLRLVFIMLFGMIGYLVGSFTSYNIYIFIFIFSILGFFSIPLFAKWVNNKDNEEMISDIKVLYDTVRVQTKSGMHLSNSLTECYRTVSNKRLKKALLEMNGRIIATNQIEEAITEFNEKFKNDYIDSFCITIRQAQKSGQSVKMLEDTSAQLVFMQKAINAKRETALDRKMSIVQMLVFINIIYITIISLIGPLTGMIGEFSQ